MEHPVIFFDGVCGLCNGFVDFVLARDKKHVFRFAPLQGQKAQQLLPVEYTEELPSFVLYHEGVVYDRSSAFLRIVALIGLPWALLSVFWIIPKPLRNFVYTLIAKNRYKLFGKRKTCRLPSPEERLYFIDENV